MRALLQLPMVKYYLTESSEVMRRTMIMALTQPMDNNLNFGRYYAFSKIWALILMRYFLILSLALLFASFAAAATQIAGEATVTDGDTLVIAGTKIRLFGIDAPETDQFCLDQKSRQWECGISAREALIQKVASRIVSCEVKGTDLYGRGLAQCSVDGVDIGRWMVKNGWALSFVRYSHDYDDDEGEARSALAGLWSGAFIAPWEWRRRNCSTKILGALQVPTDAQKKLCGSPSESPDPRCRIKATLKKECIYHMEGGTYYGKIDMSQDSRRWFCTVAEAEAAGCRAAKR
jgi:endonuclease YncB( thermonuclease family)